MMNYDAGIYFRSALTSWDNMARKAVSGVCVLQGLDLGTFKGWLADIVEESQRLHSEEENIVFIHSCNEWVRELIWNQI